MIRIAIALGVAALLIPVSILAGLSPMKSILISLITAVAFLGFSWGMSRLVK